MTFDQWCRISDLSNIDISKKLGITENYVSMLRKGRAKPSGAMVCEVYDLTDKLVTPTDWGFCRAKS